MRWWSEGWVRVRALLGRRAMERELREEISFHLEKETEKHLRRGMTPEAARREAYRRFGGVERQRERTREAWGVRGLEEAGRDLRLALRRMARSPGFTLLATCTLALGIGGTAATFALVNGLLLSPLPYPDGDRLVWVASSAMITPANLEEWREGLRSVDALGGFDLRGEVLLGRAGARNVTSMSVSDEYLSLLGARPEVGRLWNEEEALPGAPPVALVSHRVWMEELGGGDVTGRSLTVGRTTYDVIGVLPSDFHNLGYEHVDLWLPLARALGSLNAVARLREGATLAEAQDEVDALTARLPSPPGAEQLGRGARVAGLRDQFVGDARTPALVLLGAAAFVLLLACANVGNLLLSRAAGRARELAVRSALGAGRGTLVRQLLIESAALAALGGLLGLVLARWGFAGMLALAPPWFTADLVVEPRLDPIVLAFTLGLALAVTLLAGLAPAVTGSRILPGPSRSTTSRSARRWREALAAAEVAIALVLLVGTLLMLETWLHVRPASPGFEVEDRMVMEMTLPGLRQVRFNLGPPPEDPANVELVRTLTRELASSHAGVRAAAATFVPMSGMVWWPDVVAVDGRPLARSGDPVRIDFQSITPNYPDLLGMRLLGGRLLAETDRAGAPPALLVNETAARRLWPTVQSPLGRRLTLDIYGADMPRPPDTEGMSPAGPQTIEFTVVGVVADVRSRRTPTAPAEAYVSYWQVPWPRLHLVVHAPPGSGVTGETLRTAVAALDPTVPVGDVTTLEAIAGEAVSQQRYEATLMSAFGALAVLLALIGCYGVMACSVAQRTREIGVRMALGATRAGVVRQLLTRGALLVGVGLGAGLLLALGLTRVLESSLHGVSPTDPATFAVALGTLALVSLAAVWLPARRAAGVEPSLTLRDE